MSESLTDAAAGAPEKRRRGSGLARRLLLALLLLAGGWALAVTQAPVIAPRLPAPVAAWITPQGAAPGGVDAARVAALAERLAALEADAADRARAVARAEALAAEGAAAARTAEALKSRLARLEERAAALADQPAADPEVVAALGRRLSELETAATALGAGAAERAEAVAALSERIDAAESAAAHAFEARLAALEAARTETLETLEATRAVAAGGRRAVAISNALAAVDRAMTLGRPFRAALDDLERLAGEPAPEPVAMAAAAGAPTREALKARFPEAAHRAISAALVYEAGGPDETFRAIVARLRARVTGLPREPAEGDSAPAVLSRARHALLNGDLDSALAAVEALPPAARTAMDGWVVDARLRAEADHALAQWRGDLKAAL